MSVFRDNTLKDDIVKPSDWKGTHIHDEDILCSAIMTNIPMFLATGSFDGEIGKFLLKRLNKSLFLLKWLNVFQYEK